MNNLLAVIELLKQNQVVAYPTESVFGLGCNPNNEEAIRQLLQLKNRPIEKGLILVAPTKELLLPYIDESQLTEKHWQRFDTITEQAVTWIMPVHKNVSHYLTGKFNTIAVRLCRVPAVVKLCESLGFALTSTSANFTGLPPCRTALEVKQQFGDHFPVLEAETGNRMNPSEIRDIFTQHIFRQG
ncbi:tRNA threonylcarbamoyladenosine biosynthesis protein RimN [[Haemophilus] ducreyi]|uniref:Threonylcarbamoyl-AMP synthase n=2 Tax=Haemophilus ducreyi TaxID=730 RepID=TSAC_HAEDU|nr:Sua5/YciO/YrdC/YwlC family protein [[Haemophilus] ducreyi]Q7VNS3.1 RecName: Full=Threonylcarbamoyl-AMP synthase; Short=TC-AMP synthase; AltName: Full=L-threonylcarbamoyladenylate synthase; AltName: Full=t(6)A37 threonylcarbamoyladenosine biosynthesis protein TsaC; AltName: Full=tRNA threonylcarbamoyladenosine biosynthesis protein TsaC [[Haemophilus] ducreyi 35000HP]AAP95379.1 hypothetical protein HD_0414 [[Haemophilus] ducreyi 35000HP]AKO30500.1 tRNA threonylcarbamoyladenosine biosynthesis pr